MKKSIAKKALAISLLASCALAGSNQYELGLMGSLEKIKKDSMLKNPVKMWGVRGNYRLDPQWLVGLEYDRSFNEKTRNCYCTGEPYYKDPKLQKYYANLFYEFLNGDSTPYALVGVGYQNVDNDLYDPWVLTRFTEVKQPMKDGMLAQAGLGYKAKLAKHLDAFIEGKVERDFRNRFWNFVATAGLLAPFGYYAQASAPEPQPEPQRISEPEPAPAPVIDSDHDGVIDNQDRCPGTPAGISVDATGCPIDSDGDGVPDYQDRCPNTPQTVSEVDEHGCAIKTQMVEENTVMDSDGDGVVDSQDLCPDTPVGIVVNKDGCPMVIDLKINFDFNSARVKRKYYPRIRKVVEYLKAHPEYTAEIQGHTDSIGSAEYNKKLSERRAKAVYDIMVKMGVPPSRLSYVGYGEEMPIADNCTPEGRAKNRRVEVHMYQ